MRTFVRFVQYCPTAVGVSTHHACMHTHTHTHTHTQLFLAVAPIQNAYWYSLGWSTFWLVLLFIPVVILAVKFRYPLERPLSMKDHTKISSRGVEYVERASCMHPSLFENDPTLTLVTPDAHLLLSLQKVIECDQQRERLGLEAAFRVCTVCVISAKLIMKDFTRSSNCASGTMFVCVQGEEY